LHFLSPYLFFNFVFKLKKALFANFKAKHAGNSEEKDLRITSEEKTTDAINDEYYIFKFESLDTLNN